MTMEQNVVERVIEGFGDEWRRFDQSGLSEAEATRLFQSYFSTFPWERLPRNAEGFDLGCGSGRWARQVAPRVGTLHCIDPSIAIDVARERLAGLVNCRFHQASVARIPLADGSMDFGYSLGVLHHVPDTQAGIAACVRKLKPGAPFLLYLYYDFENRPAWFRLLWRASDFVRRLISGLPHRARYAASQIIALSVYLPLGRLAKLAEMAGMKVDHFPLSAYRSRSWYTMRTDALDRFGTVLERRFSRSQIVAMMRVAGLDDIRVSEGDPYWCATGFRARKSRTVS